MTDQSSSRDGSCDLRIDMPWDRWFGSFDNGTAESRARQQERMKALKRHTWAVLVADFLTKGVVAHELLLKSDPE